MARIREKRRHQRVDACLPIKIEYNKEKILTETKNISVLGAYIETEKRIPRGTSLNIWMKIPKTGCAKSGKARQISCEGVVFRCQPSGAFDLKRQYGAGIFFRSFLRGSEKDLSKYIDYILLQEKKKGKVYMRKRKQKQKQIKMKRKGGMQ